MPRPHRRHSLSQLSPMRDFVRPRSALGQDLAELLAVIATLHARSAAPLSLSVTASDALAATGLRGGHRHCTGA